MATLFEEGIPEQDSPIQSAPIRDNFTALYDKLKTLEPRATSPISTSILIQGGPVYFRGSTSLLFDSLGQPISGSQRLIQFKSTLIDLSTANGFKTIKNPNGTLSRQAITGGISPFSETGLFREILISLNNQGKLTFTEGATTTTRLSRPFDIAFDDSEIPICLVIVQQTGNLSVSGQLSSINQVDINDIRPFVTTAFQNNLTAASLQLEVEDNTDRIDAIEPVIKQTTALKVRIPPVEKLEIDGTTTTNSKLEVLSGSFYLDNKYIKFPGETIDITQDLTDPIPVDNFNQVLVGLEPDGYGSGDVKLIHGRPDDSNSQRDLVELPLEVDDGYLTTDDELQRNGILRSTDDLIPLALIYYRANNAEEVPSSGTTTVIKPIVSETFVDVIRFDYAFDIVGINGPTSFIVEIPSDVDETQVFITSQTIDLLDDNTRKFRRTISNNPQSTFNSSTRRMTVTVSESFVDLSLKRNPKAIAVNDHQRVIEDVRPFITEQ